ncbi:MAG: cytochrome c [Sulfurimonas sp.]|jgi:cytochrome c|uniref:c-type cytochrome n=1 Tax=Sulfurimonas sp. TaxID=2022749 RepID=UPI0039E4A7BA
MKLLLATVLAFLVVGCSSEAPKEEKVVDTKKIEVLEEKSTFKKAADQVTKAKDDLKEKVVAVKESIVEKVEDVKIDLETKVAETKESVKETTTEVVDSVKDTVAVVESKTIDADLLYNKCSGCHGGMGERAALGKSAVIRNWPAKQIEHALLGYQSGTYGRTMKTMMQSQVRGLSAADIKALSKYISDK